MISEPRVLEIKWVYVYVSSERCSCVQHTYINVYNMYAENCVLKEVIGSSVIEFTYKN